MGVLCISALLYAYWEEARGRMVILVEAKESHYYFWRGEGVILKKRVMFEARVRAGFGKLKRMVLVLTMPKFRGTTWINERGLGEG